MWAQSNDSSQQSLTLEPNRNIATDPNSFHYNKDTQRPAFIPNNGVYAVGRWGANTAVNRNYESNQSKSQKNMEPLMFGSEMMFGGMNNVNQAQPPYSEVKVGEFQNHSPMMPKSSLHSNNYNESEESKVPTDRNFSGQNSEREAVATSQYQSIAMSQSDQVRTSSAFTSEGQDVKPNLSLNPIPYGTSSNFPINHGGAFVYTHPVQDINRWSQPTVNLPPINEHIGLSDGRNLGQQMQQGMNMRMQHFPHQNMQNQYQRGSPKVMSPIQQMNMLSLRNGQQAYNQIGSKIMVNNWLNNEPNKQRRAINGSSNHMVKHSPLNISMNWGGPGNGNAQPGGFEGINDMSSFTSNDESTKNNPTSESQQMSVTRALPSVMEPAQIDRSHRSFHQTGGNQIEGLGTLLAAGAHVEAAPVNSTPLAPPPVSMETSVFMDGPVSAAAPIGFPFLERRPEGNMPLQNGMRRKIQQEVEGRIMNNRQVSAPSNLIMWHMNGNHNNFMSMNNAGNVRNPMIAHQNFQKNENWAQVKTSAENNIHNMNSFNINGSDVKNLIERYDATLWSIEESLRLQRLIDVYGTSRWSEVARNLPGKSEMQCLLHYRYGLNDDQQVRGIGSWSVEEDARLKALVDQQGTKWALVARSMPGRVAKQCRERYLNHLDPSLHRGPWSEDEEQQLLRLCEGQQRQWAEICRQLPGRSYNDVKNRYNLIQRRMRRVQRSVKDSPPSNVIQTFSGSKRENEGAAKIECRSPSPLRPEPENVKDVNTDELPMPVHANKKAKVEFSSGLTLPETAATSIGMV